jgi:hypothetical protein
VDDVGAPCQGAHCVYYSGKPALILDREAEDLCMLRKALRQRLEARMGGQDDGGVTLRCQSARQALDV